MGFVGPKVKMHCSLYCDSFLVFEKKLKTTVCNKCVCFGAYPSIDQCVLNAATVVIELIVTHD